MLVKDYDKTALKIFVKDIFWEDKNAEFYLNFTLNQREKSKKHLNMIR